MDRRMMAGLVGLALLGSAPTARGMQQKDPSAVGTVGYTPLDSIGDRVNGTASAPGSVPTDPTASGPAARVPTPPVGPNPVELTPQPALDEAVEQGYPTGGFGFFRRNSRAAAAARAKARPPGPAPKADPATMPSSLTWDESGQAPAGLSGVGASTASGARPLGRPAPYSGQAPDLPRRQALAPAVDDSDGTAVVGRPAPLHADTPRQARPKPKQGQGSTAAAAAPRPRPQSAATVNPRTPLGVGPAPPIPATLPGAEPITPPSAGSALDEPAPLPALGPRAAADERRADESMRTLTAVAAAPLPEPPPEAMTALPAEPAPAPEVAAGPALVDRDAPPGMPRDLPTITPVEVAPEVASAPVAPVVVAATAPALDPADPELRRTAADPTALRIEPEREKPRAYASARAAAVGDEVITVHQVEVLVQDKYKSMTAGQQVSDADKRELINMLGTMALDHLIDQSLILQEANKKLKSPKAKQAFDEFVSKRWRDERLPPLLAKYTAANEYELKHKLDDEGISYADMQATYHRDMLEHDFLFNEIKNKICVDLNEQRKYYNENTQQYDQPARIDWREIEISIAKYPDRDAARRQANAVRARLKKEDFAAVARSASDGPTASKGGFYAAMTPGSYGIPAVNEALDALPVGKLSPVIEAPTGFHIVRVDSRRAAGPLRFDEVQKKVAEAVFERNMTRAREEYLAKLKGKTLVRVMPIFRKPGDASQAEPGADPNLVPASIR